MFIAAEQKKYRKRKKQVPRKEKIELTVGREEQAPRKKKIELTAGRDEQAPRKEKNRRLGKRR